MTDVEVGVWKLSPAKLHALEQSIVEAWLVAHCDASLVPSDESNDDGLLFNFVMCLRGSDERYAYKPEQDVFIDTLRKLRR